jgi:peptidyl-prolyl cis-trans isomerase C
VQRRAALVLLVLAAACGRKRPPPPPPPPVAALVDGTEVSVAVLQREIDRLRRGAGKSVVDGAEGATVEAKDLPKLGRALLDPIIERTLLVARAHSAGMSVSDAEVQSALDALGETARASGQTLEERLAADGQTADQLAEETRDRLLAEKWVGQQTRGEQPSGMELRAFYETHRRDFEAPEQVHALQIVVTTADEAKSLLDQIRKGAAFEDVARAHSGSPDARKGGDLGWFARGTMPKAFDDACFSLKPGQVSGVVQTPYGYHLFKVLGRRGPQKRTLEQVKDEVLRRAWAEKKARAERQLLDQVRKGARVQVNEASFALLH